jgi:hypothetical protein
MHNTIMLDDLRISDRSVPNSKLQTRNQKPAFGLSFTGSELPAPKRLSQNPAITINFSHPKNQKP